MQKLIRAAIGSIALMLAAMPAAAQAESWQCAPFARIFSGIQLFGDAYSWWQKAAGKYDRGGSPKEGAVLVFKASGPMRVGHVATVSKIISERVVKVTHANWSIINGRRGQVERDVTVTDVSPNNDWSQVKVWYAPIKGLGLRAYPVYGFIYGAGAKLAQAGAAMADAGGDVLTLKKPLEIAAN
ncbi:CHAP domain-containing protein [Sphingomonas sp. 1P06PA]|uniref:CHAP domain-containing protein n=1 Tax=Sphingomonas sp. 1P06PA TaxID=554121 RepID=UPI0039A52679